MSDINSKYQEDWGFGEEDDFVKHAVKVVDYALLTKCKIKVADPTLLAPVLINLCREYYDVFCQVEDDDIPF